jgi:hydrogenase nickel incorporation protein HypA/HybF
MHELSITQNLLEICLDYSKRYGATKVHKIHLTIGEMRTFDDEWMQRYFDIISEGTMAEGAKLIVVHIPICLKCKNCSHDFELDKSKWDMSCPSCQSPDTEIRSGREFRVDFLEVV